MQVHDPTVVSPSDRCAVCGRTHTEVGGRRVIATSRRVIDLVHTDALQYDSDLLLRRKAAPGLSSYVADGCFRGWLLLTWHVTLLGGKTSVNVS